MMQIVIDIPDDFYERVNKDGCMSYTDAEVVVNAFYIGKPYEERKTGKWLDTADEYDKRAQKHDYVCLECKTLARHFISGSEDWWCYNPPKYCPNCGTKMEVDDADSN